MPDPQQSNGNGVVKVNLRLLFLIVGLFLAIGGAVGSSYGTFQTKAEANKQEAACKDRYRMVQESIKEMKDEIREDLRDIKKEVRRNRGGHE